MGNDVFANGREISCKAADGKAIAAFPDVCFTPPENPTTPPGVPIPYPNTGMAKDTTSGSKKVKISKKEVMLKNKSHFKKSMGDEAGSAAKKGVLTSVNRGKVYFNAWSMDVKFEGENVVRHLDLTTHNHASLPANSPPWSYLDQMSSSDKHKCEADKDKEQNACGYNNETGKYTLTAKDACENEDCQKARCCMLVPYKYKSKDTCCDGKSGHHLVEDHGFCKPRGKPIGQFADSAYHINDAPCVCATSPNNNWDGEHGDLHSVQGVKENYAIMIAPERQPPRSKEAAWTYSEARQAAVDAHSATFESRCSEKCIAAQLDAYYKGDRVGVDDDSFLRTKKYGFGKDTDQRANGVAKIKALAEKRIGEIVDGAWG